MLPARTIELSKDGRAHPRESYPHDDVTKEWTISALRTGLMATGIEIGAGPANCVQNSTEMWVDKRSSIQAVNQDFGGMASTWTSPISLHKNRTCGWLRNGTGKRQSTPTKISAIQGKNNSFLAQYYHSAGFTEAEAVVVPHLFLRWICGCA